MGRIKQLFYEFFNKSKRAPNTEKDLESSRNALEPDEILEPNEVLGSNKVQNIEEKAQSTPIEQKDRSGENSRGVQEQKDSIEGIQGMPKEQSGKKLEEIVQEAPTGIQITDNKTATEELNQVKTEPDKVKRVVIDEKDLRYIIRGYKWESTYRYTIDMETDEKNLASIDLDPYNWIYYFSSILPPNEPFIRRNYSESFTCEITKENYKAIVMMHQATIKRVVALKKACYMLMVLTDPYSQDDTSIRADLPESLRRNSFRLYKNLIGFVQKICRDSPLYTYEERTDQDTKEIGDKEKDRDITIH